MLPAMNQEQLSVHPFAHLFVYGTLRRQAGNTMSQWLSERAMFVGEAICQGHLFLIADYPPYPGLVPSEQVRNGLPTRSVKGDLYALPDPASLLPKLDEYEACSPGFTEPTEYVRQHRPVTLIDGRQLQAWVYVFNRPTQGLQEIVSGDFLQSCSSIPSTESR